jgi:hypothetical protein
MKLKHAVFYIASIPEDDTAEDGSDNSLRRRRIPEHGLSSFILKMDPLRNVGYEVKFKHAVLFYTASHHSIWP